MKNQRFLLSKTIFMGLVIVFFSAFWLSQSAVAKMASLIVLQSWQLSRPMWL